LKNRADVGGRIPRRSRVQIRRRERPARSDGNVVRIVCEVLVPTVVQVVAQIDHDIATEGMLKADTGVNHLIPRNIFRVGGGSDRSDAQTAQARRLPPVYGRDLRVVDIINRLLIRDRGLSGQGPTTYQRSGEHTAELQSLT